MQRMRIFGHQTQLANRSLVTRFVNRLPLLGGQKRSYLTAVFRFPVVHRTLLSVQSLRFV